MTEGNDPSSRKKSALVPEDRALSKWFSGLGVGRSRLILGGVVVAALLAVAIVTIPTDPGETSREDAAKLQEAYAVWAGEYYAVQRIRADNCMYRDYMGLINSDPECSSQADDLELRVSADLRDAVQEVAPRVSEACRQDIEDELDRQGLGTVPTFDGYNPFIGDCGPDVSGYAVPTSAPLESRCHVGALASGYEPGGPAYIGFFDGCVGDSYEPSQDYQIPVESDPPDDKRKDDSEFSRECGRGLYSNRVTSCPFALSVARAWNQTRQDSVGVVYVRSPVTGEDYEMRCSGQQPTVCREIRASDGRNDAAVQLWR